MDETRRFIFDLVRECRLNIGHALPDKPLQLRLATASPVIKNNIVECLTNLVNEGIFEPREGQNDVLVLTEHGFHVIYGA